MRKIVLLLMLVALIFNTTEAQTRKGKNKKLIAAQELFANNRFEAAKKLYSELLISEKDNLEYNFYTGICELNTEEEDNAIEHFDFVIEDYNKSNIESNFTKSAIFYKAKVFHNLYMFDQEIEVLETLSSLELNDEEKKQMETSISNANNGKQLFFDFKPIIVTRLSILNSGYDDHTPTPTANGEKLYFTSKRPGGVSGDALSPEGKYFEDIWLWEENSDPVNIGSPINTKEHDATGGLSLDGNTIFIYKASEKRLGDIYTSKFENNTWTEPVKLGKNINKRKSTERHATLSLDGKKLYFSSDRKGGIGGRDIWVSEINEDGTWGEPSNININTDLDEESPYLLSDGMTFYFSSKGYKGLGGYDIFKCMLQDDGTFSEPENIGFPVNTVEDDVFFFPLSDEETAYFTRRKTDDAEIFKTIFPDNTFIVNSDIKGKETEKDLYPIKNATVSVIDINREEHPDAFTLNLKGGKYKTVVIQDKNYKFYYESADYVFDTENISIEDMFGHESAEKEPILVKIEEGKTEKFKNTSFDENSSNFNDYTRTELDLIAKNLIKYENLVVNFSTENYLKETDELSTLRINNAVDYIESKGVAADRIYTDLSSREILKNNLEYTIYDIESVKKVIQEKEKSKEIKEKEFYIVEVENVYFNFNVPNIQLSTDNNLGILSKYLIDNPNAKIEIIGYTDAVGNSAYNDRLAVKRANTIKTYLVANGADKSQIGILGYGEDNPVSLNIVKGRYLEVSKKYNRRVEFNVVTQGNPKLKVVQFKDIPDEYKDSGHTENYKR